MQGSMELWKGLREEDVIEMRQLQQDEDKQDSLLTQKIGSSRQTHSNCYPRNEINR